MSDWNPGTLLGLSGSYWRTCALHAATKIGVFTELGDAWQNVEDLCMALGADEDGLERLLVALVAMELLQKDGDLFANTPATRRWLCRDQESYLGHMILHHHYLMESWARLDQSVMTGSPTRERAMHNARTREAFLMGMFNSAMHQAPGILAAVDLSDRSRLLDLGGGPGTYAIHFCLENPGLQAVVMDLPATRPFAEKTIAHFGLTDRIVFQEGDYTAGALSGSHDMVWMSHILHGEGTATCHEIVKKATDVLDPGGLLYIHEFILDDELDGPVFPALFSLNMLTGTSKGRSYTQSQLTDMMLSAGLSQITRLDYSGPTQSAILMARK